MVELINTVAKKYGLPVIFSTHPRTQVRINSCGIDFHPNVQTLKPLGFMDYNKLQTSAFAVLSDSGTINEESSILKFSALNLREVHERPEGMEESEVMMVGLEVERVLQGLAILEARKKSENRAMHIVPDYNVPNVSEKLISIIHSYRDYVMRTVWKQY